MIRLSRSLLAVVAAGALALAGSNAAQAAIVVTVSDGVDPPVC